LEHAVNFRTFLIVLILASGSLPLRTVFAQTLDAEAAAKASLKQTAEAEINTDYLALSQCVGTFQGALRLLERIAPDAHDQAAITQNLSEFRTVVTQFVALQRDVELPKYRVDRSKGFALAKAAGTPFDDAARRPAEEQYAMYAEAVGLIETCTARANNVIYDLRYIDG
jgi:hypothetical protein